MPQSTDRTLAFLKTNRRGPKPRKGGLTEIRGPYYTPMGKRYLEDVLETMGEYVDSLKFAGGSFALMSPAVVKELIDLAHRSNVRVSTGGFVEYVLTQGAAAVDAYFQECKDLGFDIIELSAGFITIPIDDWLRLADKVKSIGLQPKPEIGIQFGAGGASSPQVLEAQGVQDSDWLIARAKRFLDAGAEMIMIESEGITESVRNWRTEVPARVIDELGLDRVMFEAADPSVFAWYIQNYGPEINLFVDHSQIVQLECLRAGIWGTTGLWGRVQTYKPQFDESESQTK